jgi:hypothetical protein
MQALTLGGTNSLSILEWKKLGQQLSATNPKLSFTTAASPAQAARNDVADATALGAPQAILNQMKVEVGALGNGTSPQSIPMEGQIQQQFQQSMADVVQAEKGTFVDTTA